jgi:hypothetical protein
VRVTLAGLIGLTSGVTLVASRLEPGAVLGTGVVVLVCDAILCRLFAHNNGYPKTLWTLLGLAGGLWAVGVLILLPRRGGGAGPAKS